MRVEYPWHPLHGQRLRVVQRLARIGSEIGWLEERPGFCRELPAWMCDAAVCLGMTPAGAPRISVIALAALTSRLAIRDRAGEPTATTIEREPRCLREFGVPLHADPCDHGVSREDGAVRTEDPAGLDPRNASAEHEIGTGAPVQPDQPGTDLGRQRTRHRRGGSHHGRRDGACVAGPLGMKRGQPT